MTNSKRLTQIAQDTITQIIKRLDSAHLQNIIDDPILRALETFQGSLPEFPDQSDTLCFIGAYTRHIYRYGVRPARLLSATQAKANGLAHISSKDFDRFPLQPDQGQEIIIRSITTSIIIEQREAYTFYFMENYIDPWNWPLNVKITEILLEELKPLFPADMQRLPTSMFVSNLHDLITTKIQEQKNIQNLLNRINVHNK